MRRKKRFELWNERCGGMNLCGPCECACGTHRVRHYKTMLRYEVQMNKVQ